MKLAQLLECAACGAPLDSSTVSGGLCRCKFCAYCNVISRDELPEEAAALIREGDSEIRNSAFERAYSAYSRAAEMVPEDSRAYFGMALAANRIKYIKDTVNSCSQPICFEITERRFDSDKNYCLALDRASTDEQYEEYVSRAREIDYIRDKFSHLKRSGLRYDTFICVKVSDGEGGFTQDSVWAGKLYDAMKRNGLTPFYSERDIGDRVGEDYEALILYALSSAKSMIVVCSNEDYLRTPWVQNEYSRYCAMMNDEEKNTGSIMIAFNGAPIERIPGIRGKIQGVNLQSFDASQRICEFVKKFGEAVPTVKYCASCGTECSDDTKFCRECGSNRFLYDRSKLALVLGNKIGEDGGASSIDEIIDGEESRRRAEEAEEKARRRREEEMASNYTKMNFSICGTVLEKFHGTTAEVKVPYGITEIGKQAFYDCKNITSIEIPDTVEVIGNGAFWSCRGITEIHIPPSVKRIDSNAFMDCPNLKAVHITDLESWLRIDFGNLSANPTYSSGNLYICGKILTKLEIPKGITAIKPFSFARCLSLVSVTLSEDITEIGKDAFFSCEKKIEVIDHSALDIGPFGLGNGGISVFTLNVTKGSTNICELDGFLFFTNKGTTYLVGYDGEMTELHLPESFMGIPYQIYKGAFRNYQHLKRIVVPASVKIADVGAFVGCGALELVIKGEKTRTGLPKDWHKKCVDKSVIIK